VAPRLSSGKWEKLPAEPAVGEERRRLGYCGVFHLGTEKEGLEDGGGGCGGLSGQVGSKREGRGSVESEEEMDRGDKSVDDVRQVVACSLKRLATGADFGEAILNHIAVSSLEGQTGVRFD
jgi:hypothetical protein